MNTCANLIKKHAQTIVIPWCCAFSELAHARNSIGHLEKSSRLMVVVWGAWYVFYLPNPFRPSFAASIGKGDNPIDERYVFFGYTLGCPPSHIL